MLVNMTDRLITQFKELVQEETRLATVAGQGYTRAMCQYQSVKDRADRIHKHLLSLGIHDHIKVGNDVSSRSSGGPPVHRLDEVC